MPVSFSILPSGSTAATVNYRIRPHDTVSSIWTRLVPCGFPDLSRFQNEHRIWVDETLASRRDRHDDQWSQSIAVGSARYVETVKTALGISALHREVVSSDASHILREPQSAYTAHFAAKNTGLRAGNTVPWNGSDETTNA